MSPAPCRLAARACVTALVVLTGCSSSGSGNGTATTTTGVTRLTTASPERVKAVGAPYVTELRSLIADQRKRCGDDAIEPAPASVASCRSALARLSSRTHDFARALVFLHPPIDLEPIVADTIDAARPVIDTVRVFPAAVCLGAVPPSAAQRSTKCAPAGREVAEVVAAFEGILDRWKTELGVGAR